MVQANIQNLFKFIFSLFLAIFVLVPSVQSITPQDFPSLRPKRHVSDSADVLSVVATNEIEKKLLQLGDERLDARLVTIRGLNYGVSISSFGQTLIKRWTSEDQNVQLPILLFLIDAQSNQTAVLEDSVLESQIPQSLLKSTARATMNKPLREGQRYRQSSIDGLNRISVVLNGGDDPGPPAPAVQTVTRPLSIPSQDQTKNSNALIWVFGLLIIGTIVPMATWWFFSR